MTVKSKEKAVRADPIDDQVRELMTLLSVCVKGMKQHDQPEHEGVRAAFEKGELGDRHISPLLALTMSGSQSVTELAERIGLTLGTTSLLVGELNRAGLVERREDPADRRRTIVSLSEEVSKATEPWLKQALEPMRRGLKRLPPAKRANLIDGLRVINEEISGRAPLLRSQRD